METMLLIGISLIALGMLLFILEAFVPSAGIISVLAVGSTAAGIVFLFRHDMMWGWIGLLVSLVLAPASFFGAMNILPNTPMGRALFGPSGEEIAEQDRVVRDQARQAREGLVGAEGTAITDMRPMGVVQIDGKRLDAIAVGGIVDRGSAVRVVKADGLTIEVRGIAGDASG
jgi:membrane-bound serine protease (ClpP class)